MTKTDSKKILITGGHGFFGQHVAHLFRQKGHDVYGIGHTNFNQKTLPSTDYSDWLTADVDAENLKHFQHRFDCVIHCAGGASVASSLSKPTADFEKSVSTTLAVLNFIRESSPDCLLILPSSAAVYGQQDNGPISVHSPKKPVSPYGSSKKIAEDLCLSYNQFFDVNVTIIRYFSLYGPALRKQLIWDACNKLNSTPAQLQFGGSGSETRDWLYCTDAAELAYCCFSANNRPLIINGGSGQALTISSTLELLSGIIANDTAGASAITFDKKVRPGNPDHYQADISDAMALDWAPKVSLEVGLKKYWEWFKSQA